MNTIYAPKIENMVQEQCESRINEWLFEFLYLLKKKNRCISNRILTNKDCINKSICSNAHEYSDYTPLHFAVLCNNKSVVDILSSTSACCTIQHKNGQTPLHLGMTMIKMYKRLKAWESERCNMVVILKNILMANCYINAYHNMGLSHFHIACYIGDYNLVKGFLDHDANLNINSFIKFDSPYWPGYTAIHVACKYYKEMNLITLLEKYNANFMVSKDAFGLYPMQYVIKLYIKNFLFSYRIHFFNSVESIGILPIHVLCADDNYHFNENVYNRFQFKDNIHVAVISNSPMWPGYTPLHVAIHNKCRQLISILISHFRISAFQLAIRKQLIDRNIMVPLVKWCNVKASQPIDLDDLHSFFYACMLGEETSFKEILLRNKSKINKVVSAEHLLDFPGYSQLHFAVEPGITEHVKLLMRNGADPYIQDVNQMTPLHLAVLRKDIFIAKIICSHYGNVTKNPINSSGLSHMHIACICDMSNLIKKFLDYGVMVNMRTKDGQIPLHFAVSHGSETTVKLLSEHKADFTAQNIDGLTPLYLAIRDKKMNIADMILKLHSEIIVNPISSTDLSHFYVACLKNRLNLVQTFLKSGLVNHDQVKFDSDLFAGFTPLHFAVKYRYVDMVRLLLCSGASVTAQNAIKKLPLHYIFAQNREECKLILNLLWRTIKSSSTEPIGTTGLSVLHIACICNDHPTIDQILRQNPDSINQCTSSDCPRWPGYSPLHFSAKYGDAKSIKLLLSHRKNLVHSTDIYGFTPLHIACSSSRLENVEMLLAGGSDPFKNALNNLTPLRLGANNPGIVQNILNQSFVDSQAGLTGFHMALFKNNLDAVKKFLESGADPNKPIGPVTRYMKFTGWDPLLFAVYRQNYPLIEMLISHGAIVHDKVLKRAILTDNAKLMKLILRYTGDPTPSLYFLIEQKRAKLIKLLLEVRAEVCNDNFLRHMVSVAQYGGSEEFWRQTIISLLEHGVELDRSNQEGKSLLHMAYYPQNIHLLRALLRCGADVNTEDRSGRTVVSYHLEIRTSRMDLQKLRTIILEHLRVRRSVSGFELSETNEELYRTILEEEEEEDLPQESPTLNTADELELMRDTRFGGYISLFQMFRRPETVMAWCLENVELRRFLGTKRLEESFPLCSCLIRMQYGRALKRKRLLDPATSALDRLVFGQLQDARGAETCIRIIVGYLDNQDLRSLADIFR